jgi:hypothetical protein
MRTGTAAPRRSWLALTGAIYAFGVAVRIAWAHAAQPWTHAPDHLAWGLLLREALAGPVRADQLFHFPHEGWSVVDGVLALTIARLSAIDPAEALGWAALIVDSVGRAIETTIVAALFGPRVALGFTIWSAAGSLLAIENATAAYGGHLALSPWPLVALAIVLRPPSTRALALAAGSVLGVGAASGDHNLILLAVALPMLARTDRGPMLVGSAIAVTGVLLFLRSRIDLGFHLVGFQWWNIRGVSLHPESTGQILHAFAVVLLGLFPASFGLGAGTLAGVAPALWICIGVALQRNATISRFVVVVVGLFVLAYALFFAAEIPEPPFHAVNLRQFAWLAPTLVAVALVGWDRLGRWGWTTALLPVVVTAGALGSSPTFAAKAAATWDGTGFTLAEKLGHDPSRLEALAAWVPPPHRDAFWGGVGAGLGQAALRDREDVARAIALLDLFPLERRPELAGGMERRLFEVDPAKQVHFATSVWSGRVERTGKVASAPRSGLLLFGPSAITLPDTADTRLVVLASGTVAAGEGPALELWVDHALLKTVPIATDIRAYDLGPIPPQAHVELRYTNDAVDAEGNDRNLLLHWIDRDGAPTP